MYGLRLINNDDTLYTAVGVVNEVLQWGGWAHTVMRKATTAGAIGLIIH